MIEIIGEIKDATEEEIKEFEKKQEQQAWREDFFRTFLVKH